MEDHIMEPQVGRIVRNGLFILAMLVPVSRADGQELLDAARDGDLAKVTTLVEHKGVDVNLKGADSQTALIWAAYKGHPEIVKYLLGKGANVNHHESGLGKTALMLAAEAGHKKVVNLLILAKADLEATNQYGGTALMSAAQSGHLNIVEVLLNKGAQLNVHGTEGQTALMLAAGKGQLHVVKYLLSKGGEANARDKQGRSTFDYSQIAGQFQVCEYLSKPESAVFGSAFSFSETDRTTGKEVTKCTITVRTDGSSTGGLLPKGMREYVTLHPSAKISDISCP
jgi:ankyrin repeat protein